MNGAEVGYDPYDDAIATGIRWSSGLAVGPRELAQGEDAIEVRLLAKPSAGGNEPRGTAVFTAGPLVVTVADVDRNLDLVWDPRQPIPYVPTCFVAAALGGLAAAAVAYATHGRRKEGTDEA